MNSPEDQRMRRRLTSTLPVAQQDTADIASQAYEDLMRGTKKTAEVWLVLGHGGSAFWHFVSCLAQAVWRWDSADL